MRGGVTKAVPKIDVWIWSLESPTGSAPVGADVLDSGEQARAARFVRQIDRERFIAAHVRMREILADYAGLAPSALRFGTTGRAKPVLADGPAFNLSHSGGYAALAVAPDHDETALPLGLDIEAHRPIEPRVADITFSKAELSDLAALSGQEWRDGFFRCWTRKEAVIKALGTGLYMDLASFDVTLAAQDKARLTRIGAEHPQPHAWQMCHFDLSPQMPGALACIAGDSRMSVALCDAPEIVRPVFRF